MANRNKRTLIQIISAFLANGYIAGFLNSTIYTGRLKNICFPGLNCYSCPGSLWACPLGSLQAIIAGAKFQFSYYAAGFIMLIGTLTGRLVCGFICPFGFLQDLLYKIPTKKIKLHKAFGYLKYFFLSIFVLFLPVALTNENGMSTQYFCKYICPAGTLEAGVMLSILDEGIRYSIGQLFTWKAFILIAIITLAILSKRPFCKAVCPLGAIYSLFNPISFYRLKVDKDKCIKCNKCKTVCPVDIAIYENPNSTECIRCGECIKVCPVKIIGRDKSEKINSNCPGCSIGGNHDCMHEGCSTRQSNCTKITEDRNTKNYTTEG